MKINTDLTLRHYPYPSIEQFRNVIYNVNHRAQYIGQDINGEPIYDVARTKPILTFQGTVKLHGTNAGVIIDLENDIVYYQSRENIISPIKDNVGFALHMSKIQDVFIRMVRECLDSDDPLIAVYGEWCGGSIQKSVALNQLDKMFVVFNVAILDRESGTKTWISADLVKHINAPELKIFNIQHFPTWQIDIDFNFPQLKQNELGELTLKVEESCPVAKQLGKDGTGEGIVWKCIWMKVKGEKHQSSKVKTLASIDTEKLQNVKDFVESVVTENRCIQSLQKLKEANKKLDRTALGDYLRWIHNDIMKEELDTIISNGFEQKDLGSPISNNARAWFFKNELNFDSLV